MMILMGVDGEGAELVCIAFFYYFYLIISYKMEHTSATVSVRRDVILKEVNFVARGSVRVCIE